MDLNNYNLDHWLSLQPHDKFPYNGKYNYYNRYIQVKEFLDNNIHPHIAMVTSKLEKEEEIYLTDHGTDHISVVIQRISKLINVPDFELSPYEGYLLLMATQLHDSGHIKKGRTNHEKLSAQVINDLQNLLGSDIIEKRTIWQIAEAHGGRKADGKKDKIDDLLYSQSILNFPVRPQLLAALLRFGDELADDFTRTNAYLLKNGTIDRASEIFHYYASVLTSVVIDHDAREVRLHFTLDKDHIVKTYGKQNKGSILEVYLIDEIFERLYKMYLECLYCMRFIPASISINTIIAKIEFIENQSFMPFRSPISIKLTEKGYPTITAKTLYELCPEDLRENGKPINGKYLLDTIT
jgi:hypothetical protein